MKSWDLISLKTKVERWENVIRVLEGLSPHARKKHFNMEVWLENTECGTVGCAAGFCGMDPWFRRRGFKMSPGWGEDADWTSPDGFFGDEGTTKIFYRSKKRPVEAVIKEIETYIDYLKETNDGNL